ncbi:MAG: hypothetical protein JXR88_14240 [Clostridia bacterium]|nr:hypothetical protein [Clostridia bacterium]
MEQSMFIKSITIDEQERIVVAIQENFQNYLQDEQAKKMLRETAMNALNENFVQLEVSKTTFRVTVQPGTSEASKTIIENEIAKAIEMALMFMSQFGQK